MDRARLGKMVGMLGSASAGERGNAVSAIEKLLTEGGQSWGWLAHLVEHGDLPAGPRERVFKRLVLQKLARGLQASWALEASEASLVRRVLVGLEAGKDVDTGEIDRAVEIADGARRRAGI